MPSLPKPDGQPEIDEARGVFSYRGWRFLYCAERTPSGHYKPVVRRLSGLSGSAESQGAELLPNDTEEIAYATESEAMRHAEQQAMRWVNDRTGDGRGQS